MTPEPRTPDAPNASQPVRILGQYQLIEKIGQGGMGTVFRAFDTALERTIAVKVLFAKGMSDSKASERFFCEARGLARLTHPNLVHVYNVGQAEDCIYFAMELLEGETLFSAISRRGKLSVDEFAPYLGQILSALHYVHQHGITHRDIKSGNIMLCNRRAVLMDFGLAKDQNFSGLTSEGMMLGTPDYMSPEAAEGTSAGAPTDLYSLGIVMYEALTGKLPFIGRSAMSIIRQHLELPPPPIEENLPDIHPFLANAIHKCMAKKPAERYPHCVALACELVKLMPTPEMKALAAADPNAPPASGGFISNRASGEGAVPKRSAGSNAETLESAIPTGNDFAPTIIATGANFGRGASAASSKTVADEVDTSSETVVLGPETPPARTRARSSWLWVALGFFGVLLLAFSLSRLGKQRQHVKWAGQPAIHHRADGTSEEIRWLEFHGEGSDPSKWYHLIQRRKSDGSWAEPEKIAHTDFVTAKPGDKNADTLELETPAPGGIQ